MRYLVKLAFRNLWRWRHRTFLTFIAIAIGLVTFIQVDSLMGGLDNAAIENLIDLETGEIRIHAPGYFAERDSLPIDRTLSPAAVAEAVQKLEGVAAVTSRLVFGARLNTGWEEIPVTAIGIDLASDPGVFQLSRYVKGRLPAAGASEAVLGQELARILDIKVGDYFTLVTRTRNEAFQALDLEVVGVVNTPHPGINQVHVYLPLDTASAGLALDGEVTEVVLRLKEGFKAEILASHLEEILMQANIPAEVFTWREVAEEFLAISQSKRLFQSIFLLFILLIGTVGVVNTILLGALERTREIGMMKAMGMTEREIIGEFMLEATGIGVLGSLTGSLLGIACNVYLVNVGIDFTNAIGDLDIGYPVTGAIHGVWNWGTIAGAFIFGIIVCWLASYLPARKAAAQDPVKSLRHG